MSNLKYIYAIAILFVAFLISAPLQAAEKAISIISATDDDWVVATQGDTFTVDVKVDDVSEIAGAAFTVTFDSTILTLNNVTSSYFTTFTAQGITATNNTGYESPLVFNDAATGAMIAAARIDNISSGPQIIFSLEFATASYARDSYEISVTQSVISNTDAGYSASGETIPYFVGIDDQTNPVTYLTHTATVTPLTATITAEDYDGDGIADEWELNYLPDGASPSDSDALDWYTDENGHDYDKDGYSDLVEYQNRELTDLDGTSAYDPAYVNTPGGPGWKPKANIIPAILPILLDD